jgi:hypothetical protein
MRDLPVAVVLPGRLGEEVAAWVEAAGWQVVGLEAGIAPQLVLAAGPVPGRPTAVVVEGEATAAQVRAALQAGAVEVVGWPSDREALLAVPDALGRVRGPAVGAGPRRLAVGGRAGGVGTSTVALALGGLLAWSGRRTLVVGDADLLVLCGADPWTGPGAAELALLAPVDAAAELPGLARPVRGVPGLAVLGGGAEGVGSVAGWPVDAVVLDVRADGRAADLRCARPDVHLGREGDGAPVLLVGDGPLDAAGVRAALDGDAPIGRLPASARGARAGAAGRVPAGLPGSWLATLRAVVGGLR